MAQQQPTLGLHSSLGLTVVATQLPVAMQGCMSVQENALEVLTFLAFNHSIICTRSNKLN